MDARVRAFQKYPEKHEPGGMLACVELRKCAPAYSLFNNITLPSRVRGLRTAPRSTSKNISEIWRPGVSWYITNRDPRQVKPANTSQEIGSKFKEIA